VDSKMQSISSYIAFVAFLFSCYGMLTITASSCPASTYLIPLSDVQDAGKLIEFAYNDTLPIPLGFQVIKTIFKTMNEGETLKAIVASNQAKNELVIAFRGSSGSKQLTEIAKHTFVQQKNINSWFQAPPDKDIKVHPYFLDAFNRILPEIERYLYLHGNKKVIFTGHSLGGALASLLALTAADMQVGPWSNPKTSLITFGQPKIGNKEFAKKHDQLIPPVRKMIFVVDGDLVPRIPVSMQFGFGRWSIAVEYKDISGLIVLGEKSDKNVYICTLSNQCNEKVKVPTNRRDHDMKTYMLFMEPSSKWYNNNGNKKTSLPEAVAGIC